MRPETTHESSARRLAFATLIVSGDAVVPEFWTGYFNVTPSGVRTKGELYRYPSGKLSNRPARSGFWAFTSEHALRSDHLAPHLRFIKSRLALPRADLREMIQQQGAKLALWCYWLNRSGDRVPDVPDDIREMMEALGGTVELDEYR